MVSPCSDPFEAQNPLSPPYRYGAPGTQKVARARLRLAHQGPALLGRQDQQPGHQELYHEPRARRAPDRWAAPALPVPRRASSR